MDLVITVRPTPAYAVGSPHADSRPGIEADAVDIRIRARVPMTSLDLCHHLTRLLGRSVDALEVSGSRLPDAAPVGRAPLLHGAQVVALAQGGSTAGSPPARRGGGPAARSAARWGVVDLCVVGGPDCGRRVPVTAHGIEVGRRGSTSAGIELDDRGVSRRHAHLRATGAGLLFEDLGSTNGTTVDGAPLPPTGATIDATSRITIGRSRLRLLSPPPEPATWDDLGDGLLVGKPTVRRPTPQPHVHLRMPAAPMSEPPPSPPWVTMLVPIPIALALGWFFGPQLLAFAALGPLMMGASWWQERRRHRRRHSLRDGEHAAAREELALSLGHAVEAERRALENDLPHAVRVLDAATSRVAPLWSRQLGDDSFGMLRLGVGDVPSATITLSAPSSLSASAGTGAGSGVGPVLHEAPVGVRWTPGLVLDGDRTTRSRVLRHLIGQAAVLHSPVDLSIVILGDEEDQCDWVRWLPHAGTWTSTDPGEEGTHVLAEVDRRRREATRPPGADGPRFSSETRARVLVVVPPGPFQPRDGAGWRRAVQEGPAVGLSVLWAADGPPPTPGPAHRLTVSEDGSATLTPGDGGTPLAFDIDGVDQWWSDRISRSLAPIRPRAWSPGPSAERAHLWSLNRLSLPQGQASADEADPALAAEIARRWALTVGRSGLPRPVARIGHSDHGPFSIDLAADGPHLLLGGTTGSGKSEFLRALVLGMAAEAPPSALTFLLLDYKGGAAFGRCADLPHVVGLITDLDEALARRALVSLRAEIRRRETLLAGHDVDDLDGYWRLAPSTRSEELPRLVLVIDEFRVLAQEVPDFLAGVVHCAAVGRSLGIHLVLATQRPAGVIGADIQANVNLRIALRLRDASDSEQVIGSAVASAIDPSRPGTGFVRGGDGALTPFTAIRVSGPLTTEPEPVIVERVPSRRSRVGAEGGCAAIPTPSTRPTPPLEDTLPAASSTATDPLTDEAAFVSVLRAAHDLTGDAAPRAPWREPLPPVLPPTWDTGAPPDRITLGLVDRPALQEQSLLSWSPSDGPLRIIGGSGSGRSSALRTLATRLAARFDPAELHLYAVDGGGALGPLAALDHVGAVVTAGEAARLRRLLALLQEPERAEGTLPGRVRPQLVLVVDDWDLLCRAGAPTRDVVEELVATALDRRSVGVTVVVAGGAALARDRLLRSSRTIVLGGLDAADLTLLGVRPSLLGTEPPPGRGVLPDDGALIQLAPPPPPRPDTSQGEAATHATDGAALGATARRMRSGLPTPVSDLPRWVDRADLGLGDRLTDHGPEGPSEPETALALGVGHGGPIAWRPARWGRHLLIAGTSGSGRTTTLVTLAQALAEHHHRTLVVTHDPTPFDGLGEVLSPRDEQGLRAALTTHPDLAVLVDDADSLGGSAIGTLLTEWVDRIETLGGVMAVAVRLHTLTTAFRGLVPALATRQTALLLDPRSRHDGEPLGVRIDPPATRTPGRGVIVVRGRAEEIQVARPSRSGRMLLGRSA